MWRAATAAALLAWSSCSLDAESNSSFVLDAAENEDPALLQIKGKPCDARGNELNSSLTVTITALMWNPHYECFADSGCSAEATSLLSKTLQAGIDFANIVDLETDYQAPAGFSLIGPYICESHDQVTLIYNSDKWEMKGKVGEGCLEINDKNQKDRAYQVYMFESKVQVGFQVQIFGVHFPHPPLDDSLKTLHLSLDDAVGNVMLIADTNTGGGGSQGIMDGILGQQATVVQTTAEEPTCCNNDGYTAGAYDRVIASFGSSMVTQMLLGPPTPEWTTLGTPQPTHFHRPIIGTLT